MVVYSATLHGSLQRYFAKHFMGPDNTQANRAITERNMLKYKLAHMKITMLTACNCV